jgi:outer membrane scaffolding protein for murein synthesis (MipA/OmpV family)
MKYDKDHTDIIIKELTEGNGRVRACKASGISYETFTVWMELYSEFSESIKKAEAIGENRIMDLAKRGIIEKMQTQWQAAAWWLERNYPDQYKNKTESSVNVHTVEMPKIIIERDPD